MGRVGRRTGLRALDEGYEHGINYFHVASLYNCEKAEAVVGRFIQKRRQKVRIAPKVGLKPLALKGAVHLMLLVVRQVLS